MLLAKLEFLFIILVLMEFQVLILTYHIWRVEKTVRLYTFRYTQKKRRE